MEEEAEDASNASDVWDESLEAPFWCMGNLFLCFPSFSRFHASNWKWESSVFMELLNLLKSQRNLKEQILDIAPYKVSLCSLLCEHFCNYDILATYHLSLHSNNMNLTYAISNA